MANCTECGEYTKFNGGLCSKCYTKKNQKTTDKKVVDIELDNFDEESGGLTDKEKSFRYGIVSIPKKSTV